MAVVRTPISLKFDDDTSSFYVMFISRLKENKELTPLIMDLLKLYYENEETREALERYRELNSPFALIQKQISRIATSHQNTMMTTNMLGDMMNDAQSSYAETGSVWVEPKKEEESGLANKVHELDEKVDKIFNMLEKIVTKDEQPSTTVQPSQNGVALITEKSVSNLEKRVEDLNTTVNEKVQQPTYDNPVNVVTTPVQTETVQSPQTQTIEISAPIIGEHEIVVEKEKEEPVLTQTQPEMAKPQPEIEKPQIVLEKPVFETPSISSDSNESEATQETTKAKASFGKLMGSLKK